VKKLALGVFLAVLVGVPLSAGAVSSGPRELGEVVLRGLAVTDGKVSIRVDSGGCTDKAAIQANVLKGQGLGSRAPHYVVTFERVRVDDCKALLLDGTVLEFDLAKELGLAGVYTLSVANRILPRSSETIAK
jgi:hypothetical protein